ncbi:MAG: hypothetical protein ABQ298_04825 [Puniceicoccaceae bacterium]
MKPKSPRTPNAHLRRRQILILGYGTSVLGFCSAFRSEWAEITFIGDVEDLAPQVVRHGVAAGLLQRNQVTHKALHQSSKKFGFRCKNGRVDRVDPEKRQVFLEGESEALHYDYLLVGNQADPVPSNTTATFPLNSLAQAERFQQFMLNTASDTPLCVVGGDASCIDLAASLTRPVTSGKGPSRKVILECRGGFAFANRNVKPKIEDRIARQLRWEAISLLDTETIQQMKRDAITVDPHLPEPPLWLQQLLGLAPNQFAGKQVVRPDLRLREHERLFLLPELVQIVDSVGKTMARDDAALQQQGRYLARLLRGVIEVRRGFTVDQPGFVYHDSLQLATVRKGKSVGFVGPLSLPGPLAFVIDMVLSKYPVFRRNDGSVRGAFQMLRWLKHCK